MPMRDFLSTFLPAMAFRRARATCSGIGSPRASGDGQADAGRHGLLDQGVEGVDADGGEHAGQLAGIRGRGGGG
jgi:hypothetical protein